MTGKPAARRDDRTLKGGPITQGSNNVYIGTASGIACSSCPNGVALEGNPVNPLLGAKVQAGEVDLALPGPMPFVVSRDYSSYQTQTPAPVGLLGPGWWLPTEASLLPSDEALTLNDSKGRSIRFDPLAPGESAYSRSESLWIVRGGLERLDDTLAFRLHTAWMGLHVDDRRNVSLFFVRSSPLGPWLIFGPNPPTAPLNGQRLFLLGLSDRFGQALHIRRDASGAMTAVQDGAGRQYRLELKILPHVANEGAGGWGSDNGQRLMAVYLSRDPNHPVLPKEPLVRYEYSPRGELAAVFGRDGSEQRRFQYHPRLPGRMSAHHYAGREPVSYVYNNDGKVMEQHRPGLLSYRFDYQADSTIVTDSLGRTRTYHFKGKEGLRRVVKLEHADGSITQSRFDASGRLVASIDALGRETGYQLDVATGNLCVIALPDGTQIQQDYNTQGQVVHRVLANGFSEYIRYDPLGRPVASTNALGQTTRLHYASDTADRPSIIEDAQGGKKHLVWTAMAQLARFTDCSGHTTHYRYDRWGALLQTQGEEGTHSSNQYDARGRIVSQTNALNQTTATTYDAAGDLATLTAPDGNTVRYERDALGQIRVYHYGDLTQQYEYDNVGRLTRLTNENGAHTTFQYDVMDRLVEQINFDGRTQTHRYNAAGEVVESNDAGQSSHYHYDKGGRLLERRLSRREAGTTTQFLEHFEYAKDGQLRKASHVTELGGNTISAEFDRDALGRVTIETQTIIGPDGGQAWRYSVAHEFNVIGTESRTSYDGLPAVEWQTYGSGHLHGVVLDGRTLIDFERDKLHRETSRQFADVQISSTWDVLSRLQRQETLGPLEVGHAGQYRQHHYDLAGQLVRVDTERGTHQYGYDKAGRLISAVQPGQPQQNYRFDPAGNRLFENQLVATAPEHWESTVRQRINDPNFNLLGSHHTNDMAPPADRWMDNRILHDGEYHYEYDQWGNLRRKFKDESEGNEQHHYVYDHNHRLIRYSFESDSEVRGASYHYDPFGRRLVKQVQRGDQDGRAVGGIEAIYFGWDGDRLILTEKDERQIHTLYEPGSFIPLIRVESDKPPPIKSLAHQFSEFTSIGLTPELHALFDQLERELRRGTLSAQSKQWMALSDMKEETLLKMLDNGPMVEGQQIHLYRCDHLGTPLALLDEHGTVEWRIELDAWGQTFKEWNPKQLHQPIRFQGQHFDEESGLHYNRHRYYEWGVGRYVSQDPIGLFGGMNYFGYVGGNPLSYADPKGLNPFQYVQLQLLLLNQRYGPAVTALLADLAGVNGTLSTTWPGLSTLPRSLTAADLGLEGALIACKGSISYDGKTILMNVDYIEGSIKNGREVMNKLIEKATLSGAQELRIQATIANEGFYATLPRFGFVAQPGVNGYSDQFVLPILVNQIPR